MTTLGWIITCALIGLVVAGLVEGFRYRDEVLVLASVVLGVIVTILVTHA